MEFSPAFCPLVMSNINLDWEKVLHLGSPVSFPAKSVITGSLPGMKEARMYYIKRGRVRLSNVTPGGQEKMLLYLDEGCIFNEIPLLLVSSQCCPVKHP